MKKNRKTFMYNIFLGIFSGQNIPVYRLKHCVKSARIWSYSGLHFPALGLDTNKCSVPLRIQSECVKMWTRITLNTDTFYAVNTGIFR